MADDNESNHFFGDIGDDIAFRERYGERIGIGMTAVIYARDGIVAKVFREGQRKLQPFQEAYTLAAVEVFGIPAPRVYSVENFCGRTAIIMDQVKGVPLYDIMQENPEKSEECLEMAAKLQTEMHAVTASQFLPLRMMVHGMITHSPALKTAEKEQLIAKLSSLPDGMSICHGDFHGGNILFDGKSCMVIDWAEVSCGCPAADACRSYIDFSMAPDGLGEIYLEKYCAASGRTKEEILAWLPVMSGAVYGYLNDEGKKLVRHFF